MILRLGTLLFVPPQLVPHRTTAPHLCVPTPTDVLLKVNIAGLDEEVMVGWLMKRGWSSVLPMQPMFWEPLSHLHSTYPSCFTIFGGLLSA